MPVTLDLLAQLPAAEQAETDMPDLARLAQDMLGCHCYQAAWADWCAGINGVGLYAARFNGRIVGAGLVRDDALLSLGVRALTRGRGSATEWYRCWWGSNVCRCRHACIRISSALLMPV